MRTKKKVSFATIMSRIKELEVKSRIGDHPAVTLIEFLPDGRISAIEDYLNCKGKAIKCIEQFFHSGPDLFNYLSGRIDDNPILIDSIAIMPDSFYIDDSLFFCMEQEELARIYTLAASDLDYMSFYVEMAVKYAFMQEGPEKGQLCDLRRCHEKYSVEELVKRYSDHRWFIKGGGSIE